MLFQMCTKLMFGLSDVFVITVIARNRIYGVGSLFFHDRILRFGENMTQGLKRFLSNFNVVAIQNSLNRFRNTLNVRNNSKTSRLFPFIKTVTSCNCQKPILFYSRQWLWQRIHRTDQTSVGKCLKEHQKVVLFCKKENSALLEHTCLTNHTIG